MPRTSISRSCQPEPPERITDDTLVTAACRDRHAFTPLYERYASRVYRYARAKAGSEDMAEDVLSATMLDAMEQLERFNPERGTFATWLFTIATRRIADQHRAQGRLRQLAQRVWKPDVVGDDDALTSTIRRDDAAHLRRSLARLPKRDRELVLLRYHAELTSAEIGQVLGMSPTNVRVRLMRVLRRLADDLESTQ